MRFKLLRIKIILLVGLSGISIAQSIQPAKVSGRVFDPYGAVIPRVSVTLKNQSTQQVLRINSDEEGLFVFDSVRPGKYELTAQSVYFEDFARNISVEAQTENRFDVTLELPSCPDPVKRLSDEEKSRAGVCELHRERLKVGIVPIEYGLILVSDDDPGRVFPNSKFVYYGGCVAGCHEKAEVLFCPTCRKLESKWRREQTTRDR